MKLTILGSGSFMPVANRCNSGYLLDINGITVLLDSGSGITRQIVRAKRSIWEISKIFYSHFHIDHTIDLISLLFTYKYDTNFQEEFADLKIFAHPGFEEILKKFKDIYSKWIISDRKRIVFQKINAGERLRDDFSIKVYAAEHNPESLIYRFEDNDGKSLTYSGDTDICEGLISAAKNTDLLLIECSATNSNPLRGHLTPNKISKVIKDAKPKQVILTHINPENDNDTLLGQIEIQNTTKIAVAQDLRVFTT